MAGGGETSPNERVAYSANSCRISTNRQMSAVEVLRELVKRRGWQNRAVLPVVFTSTLS